MPTKISPPPAPPARRSGDNVLSRWLARSSFLLGALLFHFILFLMVATWIIFPAFHPPQEDFSKTYLPSAPPPAPPPTSVPSVTVPTQSIPTSAVIMNPNAQPQDFTIPLPDMAAANPTLTQKPRSTPQETDALNHSQRMSKIKSTVTGWGRDSSDIASSNGDPHNITAKFPVYLASYADGDWNCNNVVTPDGQIVAGSLPNLVEKIGQWSHGKIKGEVEPVPLQIAGPDLLAKAPPFIFFTGHKDFHLTDAEISNLQAYLQNGGAIWGDNALAGSGSRFDVAFRREMKRVLPDKDKNFEPMDMNYDVFTKSWFPINKLPTGMNYYNEPIEHIDIDGKLAILYTPNDYSDLFTFHILLGDEEGDLVWPPRYPPLLTDQLKWNHHATFFRNYTLESALACQQLGMNIVGYLLVRFDKELLLTP